MMDTADGAFMSQAYGWAFSNPGRKIYAIAALFVLATGRFSLSGVG